jgi:diguanylate cyclase (GGDEF)-like protein/PAS domain S-box-containing protein
MDDNEKHERARLAALQKYAILDTLPEPVFDNIVRLARYVCNVPITAVSLIDEQRAWFKARIGIDILEMPKQHTLCMDAVKNPHVTLLVEDASRDPRYAANPLVKGPPYICFYAGIPLVDSDGMVLGCLCIIDHIPRKLDAEQLHSLRTLASKVVLHIEMAYRLKQLADSEARFGTFMDHTPALCFIKDMQGRYVYVNKACLERNEKSAEGIIGKDDFELWPYNTAKAFRTHDLQVMLTKKAASVIEHIVRGDGTINHWQVEKFLLGNGDLLGGVAVNISGLKETEEQIRADQLRLEALSSTDPLTGLKNRRGLHKDFEREWASSIRYGTPLSILMMDLDHFKRVNDTLGHDAGDRVLKSVAVILKTDNRTSDLTARFGGEEFVVLLPNTEEEGAKTLAERFRQDIEALGVTTVSIGVGVRTDTMTQPDDLLKAADKALYHAKQNGRNRVVCQAD